MPECPPEVNKPVRYLCVDVEGSPTSELPMTDEQGHPLVQGPLRYCGTDDPLCEGDQVSGCISDTDGNPTSYGPAPDAPDPGNVTGPSPIMSRVRVNRTTEPVLPYSGTNHPDQLIDIVDATGAEVPFNPSTGTFTVQGVLTRCNDGNPLPSGAQVPGCLLFADGSPVPMDVDNHPIIPNPLVRCDNGQPVTGPIPNCLVFSDGTPVPVNGDNQPVIPVIPPIPVVNPHYTRYGIENFVTGFSPGYGNTPPIPVGGNTVVAQGTGGTIVNPDPVNSAFLMAFGESQALCSLDSPIPNLDRSYSTEWMVSFDGGATWQKLHENGWAVRSTSATGAASPQWATFSKSMQARAIIPPGGSVTITWGIRLNNYNIFPSAPPGEVTCTVGNVQWQLWTADNVA